MSESIDLQVPSLVLVSGLDRPSLAAATAAASSPGTDVIDVSGGLPPGADIGFVDALRPQAALPRHGVVTGIAPGNAKLRRKHLARMLLVEQKVEAALAVADRIAFIENGRIREHATPESLARDPEPLIKPSVMSISSTTQVHPEMPMNST